MELPPPSPEGSADPLWDAFVDPPDDARPRAWWHWMDGNIDPAGIERDLRWLHGVGVRGAQVFDGGMGGPLVVPAAVRPGSDAWSEAVDTAVRTSSALGMELAVATSSGWSAAGGPWVRPADAMKKVVWAEATVVGGGRVEVPRSALPSVSGPYQDCPRWGAAADAASYIAEWTVVAFPADPAHEVLVPAAVRASAPVDDWSCLTDGSFGRTLSLPRDPDGWSAAWIEQEFSEPVAIRSVVVGLPGPRGFGAAPAASALLQASDDGIDYRDVAELPPSSIPARTTSFTAVTARRFRLVLSGGSAADALPPLADGVRRPPVLRRASTFEVSEFALRAGGRVDHGEAKAGFGVVADYSAVATDPRIDVGVVDPLRVVDLTSHVRDGVLGWDAPEGNWTILRLGASLTGQTNGPAPADATGLEVDKLDGRRVREYLDTHLRRFGVDRGIDGNIDGDEARAVSDPPGFSALLSDSIESGSQNWTDAMLDHFVDLRGYDPRPWLPALAGFLVGSPYDSDRFLYDYRRTIAELLAAEYYGTLAQEAHRRGMSYYAEALEDGRPQLGDDLAMRAHADVPMGAMWTFDARNGPIPTYVADLKGAASVAHVHGKAWVGAEAFTSFDRPWASTPRSLKHVADLQLALGVTRFCIHTSPHQPLQAPPPGVALAPFLGQAFTINETWSGLARPWIDYLARCSALLAMGRPVVDIAVFVGEEAPVTGLFEHRLDTAVPHGFDFDYVGPDALRDVLRVEGEELVADGAAYRMLYLGGSSERMTLAALSAIERLLARGATVVGLRPSATPSLADDPREFDEACDRIWSAPRTAGRIMATADLGAALLELGMRPALEIDGASVRQIARLIDGRRVTFLSNPSGDPVEFRVVVAEDSPLLVGWDPVQVEARRLEREPTSAGRGRRAYRVSLPAFGSLFVLPSPTPLPRMQPTRSLVVEGAWRLTLPGRDPLAMSPHPALWTDLDAEACRFSGTGVYRHEFTLDAGDAAADHLTLNLGDVRDIARVRVNGVDCGVAWTEPFRVDVTRAVRAGANALEVEVVTPWRNRLIAEAGERSGEVFEPMTAVFEASASPLPAGLAGPVSLSTTTVPAEP